VSSFAIGVRAYLAVGGGIIADHTLGSRSTDTLSGLGPAALIDGDRLPIGIGRRPVELPDIQALITSGVTTVDVVLGPRNDWFTISAVARHVQGAELNGVEVNVNDVAASFQDAVCDVLTAKTVDACKDHGVDTLLVGGGVAANGRLRALIEDRAAKAGLTVRVPRPGLCTDNGAMVAALGAEVVRRGLPSSSLDLAADSSLPVTTIVA
jgi:hypothetical protein